MASGHQKPWPGEDLLPLKDGHFRPAAVDGGIVKVLANAKSFSTKTPIGSQGQTHENKRTDADSKGNSYNREIGALSTIDCLVQ